MKSRTEILVPLAAIQAVPIAVIAWYRLHRYAWYRYSAIVTWAIGSTAKAYFRNEYLGKSKLTKEELGEIFRKAFRDQKNK